MRIIGTGQVAPESMEAITEFFRQAEEHTEAEVARAKELSRLSGMEVVYDLSMFDEPWSPVYRHNSSLPVAWVGATGERRAGPDHPELGVLGDEKA